MLTFASMPSTTSYSSSPAFAAAACTRDARIKRRLGVDLLKREPVGEMGVPSLGQLGTLSTCFHKSTQRTWNLARRGARRGRWMTKHAQSNPSPGTRPVAIPHDAGKCVGAADFVCIADDRTTVSLPLTLERSALRPVARCRLSGL